MGEGFGQSAPQVRVEPFPNEVQQPLSTSTQMPTENMIGSEVVAEEPELNLELPSIEQAPVSNSGADSHHHHHDGTPSLPRQRRHTRHSSRPLAPLDEARRILSQVETQRAAADAATARAFEQIAYHLGRLADAAEVYLARTTPQ